MKDPYYWRNKKQTYTYARRYLDWGLLIIPLNENKRPLFQSWERYAHAETRATLEEFREWIGQYSHVRLGMITGRESGLIAVHLKPGSDASRWPFTASSKAPFGGKYLYYKHPCPSRPGSVMVPSATDFLPYTDLYGEGGIVPVQSLPNDANAWIEDYFNTGFAEVPDDVLPLILHDPDYVMSSVPEGVELPETQRSNAAEQFINEQLKDIPRWKTRAMEATWPLIQLWNSTVAKRPYDDEAMLRSVFDDLMKWHRDPRNLSHI